MKWIDYKEWKFLKQWFKVQGDKAIEKYLTENKGLYDQINQIDKEPCEDLTLEKLEQYMDELGVDLSLPPMSKAGMIEFDKAMRKKAEEYGV